MARRALALANPFATGQLGVGRAQMAKDGRAVAGQHTRNVQPQTWELLALDNAVGVRRKQHVLAALEPKPVDRPIVDAPDDVLTDLVAAVRLFLLMQIVGDGASGNLNDQLRRPFEIDLRTPLGMQDDIEPQARTGAQWEALQGGGVDPEFT